MKSKTLVIASLHTGQLDKPPPTQSPTSPKSQNVFFFVKSQANFLYSFYFQRNFNGLSQCVVNNEHFFRSFVHHTLRAKSHMNKRIFFFFFFCSPRLWDDVQPFKCVFFLNSSFKQMNDYAQKAWFIGSFVHMTFCTQCVMNK